MHPDSRAVFSSLVPGCQANMANWLCYSETLIFTQLTKSLWRLRVLHALCWARETGSLTRQQMHSFWKQSAFILFFLSCNYPVRPLPVTCQSLESICNVWTYIWTSSPQLHVPVWWMSSKMSPWEGQAWPKGRQKGFILLFRGKNKLNGRTFQKIV